MLTKDVLKYYSDKRVVSEIIDYCRMRWVAAEAKSSGDKRIFFRYWGRDGPPLSFKDEYSFKRFLESHVWINVRSFYGSVNIYGTLSKRDDLEDLDNIVGCTPIWDIDGSLSNIKLTLDATRIIISFLESRGVCKSIYLKWSGRGLHIHLHENAISKDVLSKIHPLDAAYAIVEYTINKCWNKIRDIVSKASNLDREFKVENKIDIQRVFTSPLSLHREYDIVTVCFKPNEIDSFDISWTNPSSFKHNLDWKVYVDGEADELALESYREVGGYIPKMGLKSKSSKSTRSLLSMAISIPTISGHIGRFQTMALLQAARYYVLRGDIDKAKSFGLNRAIFYAWAKYYKPRYGFSQRRLEDVGVIRGKYSFDNLGDEKVPISSSGYYVIGDAIQTPDSFDKEIASKISSVVSFNIAWEAAIDYVKRFSKETLESQQEFYKRVYEPVRDNFVKIVQEYMAFKKFIEDKK